MRALEIVLLVVVATAAVLSLFGPSRLRRLRLVAVGVVAGATIVQVIVEGPRVPMVPLYVAAAAVVLAGLLPRQPAGSGSSRRRWGVVGRIVTVMVVGALVAVGGVASTVLPVWTMPAPTGPYAIGAADFDWVDTTRPNPFTADPDDDREVMATVWYPVDADAAAGLPRQAYPEGLGVAISLVFDLPAGLFGQAGLVRTHVVADASPATRAGGFPVVLFSPGVRSTRFQSMAMVENLVSEGFVVVGIDHPYSSGRVTFSDGRTADFVDRTAGMNEQDAYQQNIADVAIRGEDVSFVIGQLETLSDTDAAWAGVVDLATVGMVGHSYGGATTEWVLVNDDRVQAAVDLEGGFWPPVPQHGFDKPYMYVMSASSRAAVGRPTPETEALLRPTFARDYQQTIQASTGPLYFAQVDGFNHQSFTDIALVSPILFADGMSPEHNVDITRTLVADFFEHYLLGRPFQVVGHADPDFPEVTYLDPRTAIE